MLSILKKILLFNFILFVSISMVSADVSNLKITPEHPKVGDTIRIKGDATPNELLDVSIDFTKMENVAHGNREYIYMMDFENPQKSNFAVTAEKVENLNVGVQFLIWWTRSVTANDKHIAQISQNNVPAGNYHIKIDGTAAPGQSSVSLKIKVSSIIHASPNGKFEFSYSTKGLPEGTYRLNVEGKHAQINLLSKNEKPRIQSYVVSGFNLNSSDNTGLQGWTISISNDTINMQDVTDVNGSYMFSGLSNGTYTLTENPMTDWTNVSPRIIEVTVNGTDLPNQNFTNMPTAPEIAYIVIIPYSVSLHTGEELQFHAQASDANDTKIDANISYVIKNNQSNVGTITESGLFSALKSGSVRITASSGDISDTAVVTVTNIDHQNRHGNRHHNSGGWQEYIGAVN